MICQLNYEQFVSCEIKVCCYLSAIMLERTQSSRNNLPVKMPSHLLA